MASASMSKLANSSLWSVLPGVARAPCCAFWPGSTSADSGDIFVGGRDMSPVAAADRNIAMVFQSYALYPHLTAADEHRRAAAHAADVASAAPARRRRDAGRTPHRRFDRRSRAIRRRHPAAWKAFWTASRRSCRVASGSAWRLARAMVRQPNSLPDGRAAQQPRCQAARAHARRDRPAASPSSAPPIALRDARPGRGDDDVGPRRGHDRRRDLLQLAAPDDDLSTIPPTCEVAQFRRPAADQRHAGARPKTARVGFDGSRLALAWRSVLPDGTGAGSAIRPEFVELCRQRGAVGLAGRDRSPRNPWLRRHCPLHVSTPPARSSSRKLAPREATDLIAGMPVGVLLAAEQAMVFGAGGNASAHRGARAAGAGMSSVALAGDGPAPSASCAQRSRSRLLLAGAGHVADAAVLVGAGGCRVLCSRFTDYQLGAPSSLASSGFENYSECRQRPHVPTIAMANTLVYVGDRRAGVGCAGPRCRAADRRRRTSLRGFYPRCLFPAGAWLTLIAMAIVWEFMLHPRSGRSTSR